MKSWPVFALLFVLGCGVAFPAKPNKNRNLTIRWASEGNPTVPVCGTVKANCKATIEALDTVTRLVYTVSVTSTQITVPYGNPYSIRTSGFDNYGNPLHSYWEAVP